MTPFERDEKGLMSYYFDSDLFPTDTDRVYSINKNQLELIVRPDCTQKCEYCYIYKYGKELYPHHVTKEENLHNIKLFLDYIYRTRKTFFYSIELFAGDLFFDDIFFDIMDLYDEYFKEIQMLEPEIFRQRLTTIIVPSNLSFIPSHPEKADKILEYIDHFMDCYNTRIMFSWSSDGLYAVDTREKKECDEEFFDKIFEFCLKAKAGSHPMVAACNIDNWIKNYDWWMEKFKQYDSGNLNEFQPMMLEVRNDDWTPEAIESYKNLLTHMMEKRLELCGGSKEKLAKHLFEGRVSSEGELPFLANYDPLHFPNGSEYAGTAESITCGMQAGVHLDCTSLRLVLCHRLTYRQFVGVDFITDEDNTKIVDFKPYNTSAYINIRTLKINNHPKCPTCDINPFCMKGCLGAQYESNGEILQPCKSVCNMFHAKFLHLIKLFNEYGLIAIAKEKGWIREDEFRWKYILQKSKEMGYEY